MPEVMLLVIVAPWLTLILTAAGWRLWRGRWPWDGDDLD